MRYWWVNQNQTYRQEIGGGYLWSPKRKTNHQRNPFYESMREVAPGDVIFSFVDTRILALGIARSYCYESPKPTEFGSAGSYWGAIGWKVDVSFQEISNRIRPKDYIRELRGSLPEKYSPLRPTGDGLQSVYLTAVGPAFAAVIFRLIGPEVGQVADVWSAEDQGQQLSPAAEPTLEEWEHRIEAAIQDDRSLGETEREALVRARRGQGLFRSNVQTIERACRVTRVERREHLVASHVKPWRDSTNDERLDGENGLLLTPTVDHLFDKGFISFEDAGNLIISPVADRESLQRMGVAPSRIVNVGTFSERQRHFLAYHRENVLRMSELRTATR
jgi:hypothetical protein